MTAVTLEEAQAKLPELIDGLAAGEELLITRNQQPVARLVADEKPKRKPRKAGNCKGMLTCQRAVKASQVGEMKSSHFERSEVRRRGSSTASWLTEASYGERTQDGDCRRDTTITNVTLVRAADRPAPGN